MGGGKTARKGFTMEYDKYYVLNDLNGYGNAHPVCVTYDCAFLLMHEWYGSDVPDFNDIWHVASDDEIREYGYGGAVI